MGDYKVADISLADFGRKVRSALGASAAHRAAVLAGLLARRQHLPPPPPPAQELDLAEVEMPGLMQCRTEYAGSLA